MSKVIIDSNGRPFMDANGKVLSIDIQPRLQSKNATPSTSQQTISPDSGYDGLSGVTVGAVSAAIDQNIVPGNIKQGVSILGVAGTLSAGNPIQANLTIKTVAKTSLSDSGLSLTVAVSGTYMISWAAFRSYSSGTFSTRAYVNGSAVGTDHSTWTNSYGQQVVETGINLTAGQTVEIYARSSSTSRYTGVSNLVIEKTA